MLRQFPMFRKLPVLGLLLFGCLLLMRPAAAQNVGSVTFFGGALLGSPTGFAGGAGLGLNVTHNITFEPTFAIGRAGHENVFTLDGSFLYNFHLQDGEPTPYILGGVGMSQYGGATHGSPLIGAGVRFPLHNGWQLRPEVRVGTHGLSRFTIGLTRTF